MIKIENVVTPSPEQWKAAIMGARNPLNSWDRYDSGQGCNVDFVDRTCDKCDRFDNEYEYGLCINRVKKFIIGPNDYGLLKRLCEAGTDHRKFMRMIPVIVNQKRTVMLNYEVLANIYKSRKNHKLDEWCLHGDLGDGTARSHDYAPGFCDLIKTLPYSELITGEDE